MARDKLPRPVGIATACPGCHKHFWYDGKAKYCTPCEVERGVFAWPKVLKVFWLEKTGAVVMHYRDVDGVDGFEAISE